MLILIQYWKYVLVLVSFLLFSVSLGWMKIVNTELRADRDMCKTDIENKNASLLQQKKEYDEKLSKLPTETEKITVKYKVIYKDIDDWKGDKNATDYENVDKFLNSIIY
jgi:hypothetical protein